MDRIFTQLQQDHGNMLQLLDTFEGLLAEMAREGRDPSTLSLLLDTLDYIAIYPDKWHHPVEELIYDALLHKPGVPAEPILRARTGHQQLARESRAITDLLYAVAHDCAVDRDHLQATARRYLDLQRAHMALEENDIFPLVEAHLSEADWCHIHALLKSRDNQVFNPALRCQFDALAEYVNEAHTPATA